MSRLTDAQDKVDLLLHPQNAPLPSDDEIAEFLEKAAVRLENATARSRQMDQTIRRLTLAKTALTTAQTKEAGMPDKALEVQVLKEDVQTLAEQDGSAPVQASAAPPTTP